MVKAADVQRARNRVLAADIDRQTRAYEAQRPERVARNDRIKSAKRQVRRALHARDSARRAIRAAEAAAGAAVRRLLDEGLSITDTALLVGLSRHTLTRLTRIATDATGPRIACSSTEQANDPAPVHVAAHGESDGTVTGARNEGNL